MYGTIETVWYINSIAIRILNYDGYALSVVPERNRYVMATAAPLRGSDNNHNTSFPMAVQLKQYGTTKLASLAAVSFLIV